MLTTTRSACFRLFLTFTMVTALVGFSACDQSVQLSDGRLPQELIPYAQVLVGNYAGQVDRKPITLTIGLETDGKLRLSFSEDIVASSCGSQIGNLKEITYGGSANSPNLTSAMFEFDPGQCLGEILGNEILIKVKMTEGQPIQLNLQLLDHYETQQRCGWDPPTGKGGAPTQNCRYETYPWHVRGKLTKN